MKQKHTNKKKALITSVLSTTLCTSMLIGTTFAWFTDTEKSGNNRIVAGNLDIEMKYMDDKGNWQPVPTKKDDETTEFFNLDGSWEPGKVIYEQFQIVNKGNLAVKFSTDFVDIKQNVAVNPNEDKTTYSISDGSYSLADVLQVAVYKGTMDELLTELNKGKAESDKLTKTDRRIINEAVEKGLISFYTEEGSERTYHGISEGNYYESALAPAGNYLGEKENGVDGTLNPIDLTFPGNDHYVGGEVKNAIDTEEITVFVYWEPGMSVYGECSDDDYNLNNGKKATKATLEEIEGKGLKTFQKNDVEDGLYIKFDFSVEAAQIPHENDSFGDDYDENAEFPRDPDLIPPGI